MSPLRYENGKKAKSSKGKTKQNRNSCFGKSCHKIHLPAQQNIKGRIELGTKVSFIFPRFLNSTARIESLHFRLSHLGSSLQTYRMASSPVSRSLCNLKCFKTCTEIKLFVTKTSLYTWFLKYLGLRMLVSLLIFLTEFLNKRTDTTCTCLTTH